MLDDKYVTMEIEKVKHIALVAHDGKKRELVDWCEKNKEILKGHFLCGTGTTARLIAERTGLPVKGYCSGPLGGDQQIGAKIVEGQIDFMIFLWDPLEAQPHDPDVKARLQHRQYAQYKYCTVRQRFLLYYILSPSVPSRSILRFHHRLHIFPVFSALLLPNFSATGYCLSPFLIFRSFFHSRRALILFLLSPVHARFFRCAPHTLLPFFFFPQPSFPPS